MVNVLIPNYYEGELAGEVLLDVKNISRLPLYETAKYVGSVFQNPQIQFFTVDSASELAFGCENQELPESKIIHRAKSTAVQFDMEDLPEKNRKLSALLFLPAIRLLSFWTSHLPIWIN